MMTSVARAFLRSGGRNTLTALEMASVPVSAEPPSENARRMMNSDAPRSSPLLWLPDEMAPVTWIEWACRSPSASFTRPTRISTAMLARKT